MSDPLLHRRLPPLHALRLFEAAARSLSFKAAAEELHLTPSAVSHGIRALEASLGAALFQRKTRALALTAAGEAFYACVEAALRHLAEGAEAIRRAPRPPLSISAAPTFASRLLLPALAKLRQAHPEFDIVVDTAHEQAQLRRDGSGMAIRMGKGDWPGHASSLLLRERLVPVCTPDLAAQIGALGALADLPLIHIASVSEDWAYWAAKTGRPPPEPGRGLRFDTIQLAFEAAARGLGIVLGRRPLVDAELTSGALTPIGEEIAGETGYWLVTLKECAHDPAAMLVRDWLARHLTPAEAENRRSGVKA